MSPTLHVCVTVRSSSNTPHGVLILLRLLLTVSARKLGHNCKKHCLFCSPMYLQCQGERDLNQHCVEQMHEDMLRINCSKLVSQLQEHASVIVTEEVIHLELITKRWVCTSGTQRKHTEWNLKGTFTLRTSPPGNL